jgi:adenosylcobinamide-GDP ribazoletransferase
VRAAVGFLTVFGGARTPDDRTLRWFPLVGTLLGLAVGGLWWGATEIWPPAVAAALAVSADLVLTGMLHFDGLSDSADGLLPPLGSRERRLEVMRDPRSGAFGVTVVVMTLVLRVVTLTAIEPHALALAALWCTSRSLIAVAALTLCYARSDGLAAAFLGPDRRAATAVVVGTGAPLAIVLAWPVGSEAILGVVVTVLIGAAVLWFGVQRLGGFTGDVLGAAAVVAESGGLLVLAARW